MKSKFTLVLPIMLFGITGQAQTTPTEKVDANGKTTFSSAPTAPKKSHANISRNIASMNLNWNTPVENVSESPDLETWNARLAIGTDNSVNVVYNDNHPNGLQKIMFRKKVNGQWSEPIYVDKGDLIEKRNNHVPAIAASPNGDLHVIYTVWAYANLRNYMGYSRYDAATGKWSDGVKISDVEGTIAHMSSVNVVYSTANSLPVAIWGYDNRENENVEEIYMTYFDGTKWSPDIAVSKLSDGFRAVGPQITSMGNQKAMILYKEYESSDRGVVKYRIYDEITHELTAAKNVNLGDVNALNFQPLLNGDGKVNLLVSYKSGGLETVRIAEYDKNTDIFSYKNGSKTLPNKEWFYGWDCNKTGDCGIALTATEGQDVAVINYNPNTGFSDPVPIADRNWGYFIDRPYAKFDALDNYHVIWTDSPAGLSKDVLYKVGLNKDVLGTSEGPKILASVYPNPSKGAFTIKTNNSLQVEVFSATGSLIEKRKIAGTSQFNLSVPPGLYLIKMNDSKQTTTTKLLIQ